MRLAAAAVGLGVAAAAASASAQAPATVPPTTTVPLAGSRTAPTSATDAAMSALLSVCRPAAEQDQPASAFAERLGYAPQAELPANLPIVHAGARSWRAPSAVGEVYVVSGAVPEPAQQSACMVAVYGDPASDLEARIAARIAAPDLKFRRDAAQSFATAQFQVTHYVANIGYLVRNVMVARALEPASDYPTISVITYRVDYSWLRSVSH